MNPNYKEKSIPLVTFDTDNQNYQINQEAVDFIKTIPAPIGVIGVAGLYRTGKSYLLNRMLLNRSNGFGVGPTVNPCTKGLWVWGTPIAGKSPEGTPINILIIDSEGIGALDEDQSHDSKIFSLAILLSSQFIYNSVGSIDENAVQNLSLVVNLTKHIQIKSNGNDECDSEEYSMHFPAFFWVIRDFSLQLVDHDGEPITSKDYLERALMEQRGFSDEVEQKNRIRRLLTSFFKERECVTLVRPLVNEDNLQKLDQMEMDQLRPEFFDQVNGFRKRMLAHCKPKTMNGKPLNGEMYISLVGNYINSINDGAVPNIENAWNYVCKDQCYKSAKAAYEVYEKYLKENLYSKTPTTNDELKYYHKVAKEAALETFEKQAIGDVKEEFEREVSRRMKEKFNQVKMINERDSKNTAEKYIKNEFQVIEQKLRQNEYKNYHEFEHDVTLFQHYIKENGPIIQNGQHIYISFLRKAQSEGANFFIQNLQDSLEIQKECSEEQIKKLHNEIKEIKDSHMKTSQNFELKLSELEKHRQELLINEKRNDETIREQQEQFAKAEAEYKKDMQKEKQYYTETTEKLTQKSNTLEEELQTAQRDILLQESSYTKEKALLDAKIKHYETIFEEHNQKEKQYDNNMVNAKDQLNSQLKELQEKYDQSIKNEKNQNQQLQNKYQELLEDKETVEKQLESEIDNLKELNKSLQEKYTESNSQLSFLNEELEKIKGDHLQQSQHIEDIVKIELENYKQQSTDLSEKLKEMSEKLKSQEQDFSRKEAVILQKSQFLKDELEDTKQKLEDQRQAHQSTLNALELSNLEQQRDLQSQKDSKYLLEMKEAHMKEFAKVEQEMKSKISSLQEKINSLTQSNQDLDIKLKVSQNDLQGEIASLKENNLSLEEQKNSLQEKLKAYEETSYMNSQQSQARYQGQVKELELTIEELREKMQKENFDMQAKSQEQLAQLKNYYEIEKERLENRINEEKDKRLKLQDTIQEEYEEKLKEQAAQNEEEVLYLKEEIQELEMQLQTATTQYEHEVELISKNLENSEKCLHEAKEQLSSAQSNYNAQLEQQQQVFNKEKLSLQSKYDSIYLDLQRKDKDFIKIQQKKEAIESAMARKEDLWETTKADLIQERNAYQDKLEETRKTHQKLQDEFLQHKISYEKSIALSTQQNDFFDKKVEDLQKQLELSSQRYEERIKQQKQEWQIELNDKIGRLQEEKQTIEQKYDALKKTKKEGEFSVNKKVSVLEKEKAILQEKLTHVQTKLSEIEGKSTEQLDQLNNTIKNSKQQYLAEKKAAQSEIEALKKQINTLETEKHELQSGLEKDRVLWEGKFEFLQNQKDQAKTDLQESRKNFEITLQKLKEARQNDLTENEKVQSLNDKLANIERQYENKIKELNDNNNQVVQDLNSKISLLQQELKQYQDKSLLDQHNKNSTQAFQEKRLNEMAENEKKLLAQIETLKQQKEQIQLDVSQKMEKEKETYKQKINEVEEKCRQIQQQRSTLIFEQEKEKAKWGLEKDHLLNQRADLQEQLNKCEKKREQLVRENAQIKSQRHGGRFNQPNSGTSFLDISRNIGTSDRKTPISTRAVGSSVNNRGGNYASNYSMVNNSFHNSEENEQLNNKENSMNILGQLDSSRDKDYSSVNPSSYSNKQGGGFMQFYQQQQQDNTKSGNVVSPSKKQQTAEGLQERDLN